MAPGQGAAAPRGDVDQASFEAVVLADRYSEDELRAFKLLYRITGEEEKLVPVQYALVFKADRAIRAMIMRFEATAAYEGVDGSSAKELYDASSAEREEKVERIVQAMRRRQAREHAQQLASRVLSSHRSSTTSSPSCRPAPRASRRTSGCRPVANRRSATPSSEDGGDDPPPVAPRTDSSPVADWQGER